MIDITLNNVSAVDAISNIREKLAIPTQRWDDFLSLPRSKAFTVAGAAKIDLVNDFQEAISTAVEGGESISQFRARFDKIVTDHGWSYKGSRGWRTRVIYDNNLRSAHMAGRWKQIERVKARRPYLIYNTVNDNRVREEHLSWHQLVLPVDDAWWDTHYPPNGWGCRCYIVSANDRTLEKRGLTPTSKAPALKSTERINVKTGEVYGKVPKGIDVGWNNHVGKQWLASDNAFGEKIMTMAPKTRTAVLKNIAGIQQREMAKSFTVWSKQVLDSPSRGLRHTIGWLNPGVIDALATKSIVPVTAAITISDKALRRMQRELKVKKGIDLPTKVLQKLPAQISRATAVLSDKQGGLVFVLPHDADSRRDKLVAFINFKDDGELTNSVRSSSTTTLRELKNKKRYELLSGKL